MWGVALVLMLACSTGFAQSSDPFSPDYSPTHSTGYVGPADDPLDWKEGGLTLPPYPQTDGLVEFEVRPSGSFRFFVDANSVVAGSDGVVRYTLVVRSGAGAENVSFDGLRCKNNEHRVYAIGLSAKRTWSVVRDGKWKALKLGGLGRQHLILMRDFFCPSGIPIAAQDEGVDALRRGGHPQALSNHHQFRPQ